MKNPLLIGNAQGFWGDRPGAAAELVKQQPDLDYLTLDYLAEVSLSILAIQKEKDSALGYAKDFVDVVSSLIPYWKGGSTVKIVTNAGGLNPLECARECRRVLDEHGCSHIKIGVVSGDDVMTHLTKNPNDFHNLDTYDSLNSIHSSLVTANAYLGAEPIVRALKAEATIVITGRVSDVSLTVAPCLAHFGWSWTEYDKLAGATVAGHLIECGTQVTGGISTKWLELQNIQDIGYPYVEMHENGTFVITKPAYTGGSVCEETVKEQLLYEIGDPDNFLTPDVIVSLNSLVIREEEKDRVFVEGAKGKAPTDTFKVSATYRDGYRAEALLALFGPHAARKARLCGDIVLERVREAGYHIERSCVECLGDGAVVPSVVPHSNEVNEVMLRIAVASHDKEALEYFAKEIAPLVTSGPQGVTGYTTGRSKVRPVFGYWPCLISKERLNPKMELLDEN